MLHIIIIRYLPYICIFCSIISSILSSIGMSSAGTDIKCAVLEEYSILGNILGDDKKDKYFKECK